MATVPVVIPLSDLTDQADLSVVHEVGNIKLGPNGLDPFDSATWPWWWTLTDVTNWIRNGDGTSTISLDVGSGATTAQIRDANFSSYSDDYIVEYQFDNYSYSGTDIFRIRLRAIHEADESSRIDAFIVQAGATFQILSRVVQDGVIAQDIVNITANVGGIRIERVGDYAIIKYKEAISAEWIPVTILDIRPLSKAGHDLIRIALLAEAFTDVVVNMDIISYRFMPLPTLGTENAEQFLYDSSSPQPNSVPWAAFGFAGTFDMSMLDIITGGTGTVEYQYAINGGPLNGIWLTEAQLKAVGVLVITDTVQSMRIVTRYISNSTQPVVITQTISGELDITLPGAIRYPGIGSSIISSQRTVV